MLDALSPLAIEAAVLAAQQSEKTFNEVLAAHTRDLQAAQYEADVAARRHAEVDPERRLVARELEARWERALERVREIESQIAVQRATLDQRPSVDRDRLKALASDLCTAWNAEGTSARTKQQLTRTLIREVVLDVDLSTNEHIVVIHWIGGRHSEVRVARRAPSVADAAPKASATDVVRALAPECSDREIALTLNRMRSSTDDGQTWTRARVETLRKRLGLDAAQPSRRMQTVSIGEAANELSLPIHKVKLLIKKQVLRASQPVAFAPWRIDRESLRSKAVQIEARQMTRCRAEKPPSFHDERSLKLPGL
jgi:hypothetical protein